MTPEDSELSRRHVLKSSLALLLSTGFVAGCASATAQIPGSSRILVAYLTRSGNTRVIAGYLERRFGADLFQIRTAEPYPEDYQTHVDLAQREAGIRPELAENIANYEMVFLGFPIWGVALPVPELK